MIEFEIDRAKWATGSSGYACDNHLLNDDGTMCCLGFFCNRVAKIKKDELLNVYDPKLLPEDLIENKKALKGLVEKREWYHNSKRFDNTDICNALLNTNDDVSLNNKEREKAIAGLFKELGYKVKFVGRYAKLKGIT